MKRKRGGVGLERANDPDPDPEGRRTKERCAFHSPAPRPAAQTLCPKGNTPTPTERKGSGEGARGGREEPKTRQAPSGGGIREGEALWGTKGVSFGSFFRRARICVCAYVCREWRPVT